MCCLGTSKISQYITSVYYLVSIIKLQEKRINQTWQKLTLLFSSYKKNMAYLKMIDQIKKFLFDSEALTSKYDVAHIKYQNFARVLIQIAINSYQNCVIFIVLFFVYLFLIDFNLVTIRFS